MVSRKIIKIYSGKCLVLSFPLPPEMVVDYIQVISLLIYKEYNIYSEGRNLGNILAGPLGIQVRDTLAQAMQTSP